MRIVLLIVLCSTLHIHAQTRYESNLFAESIVTNYKYGQNTRYNGIVQDLTLDLYTGIGDIAKNRVCVVFCFGGSFVSGSRTSAELVSLANTLSRLGYVCASIDYRIDDTANMTTANNEGKAVIRAVQDAKAAIRYLKSNSDALGIDSSKIFIGGTSAGGVTALTLGYTQYDELSPYIKVLADSLGGWEGTTNTLSSSSTVMGLFNFAGGIFDTAHIRSGDLPVYLNHATGDPSVPYYSGLPLNSSGKTTLYGSGSIRLAMMRKGNFFMIDSFVSSNHPAFVSTNILADFALTTESLKTFLLKVHKSSAHIQNGTLSPSVSIAIFPNPASEYITISCAGVYKEMDISLYDVLGNKINSIPMERHSIRKDKNQERKLDISSLQTGIYYLKYENQIAKFIKE